MALLPPSGKSGGKEGKDKGAAKAEPQGADDDGGEGAGGDKGDKGDKGGPKGSHLETRALGLLRKLQAIDSRGGAPPPKPAKASAPKSAAAPSQPHVAAQPAQPQVSWQRGGVTAPQMPPAMFL